MNEDQIQEISIQPDVIPSSEQMKQTAQDVEAPLSKVESSEDQTELPNVEIGIQSEQELIEQLKNDNIEIEEEQFVLSPDDPGLTAVALYGELQKILNSMQR